MHRLRFGVAGGLSRCRVIGNLAELLPVLAGVLPEQVGDFAPGCFGGRPRAGTPPPLYGVLDDWRSWAAVDDAG
jgi:dethiobiotin synthetase